MYSNSILYLILGHILSLWYSHADLMDLISEARCAALCFQQFTKSLEGAEKEFLQKRPDLTQPHCINRKGTCALCLDVCQWPKAQTTNCKDACKLHPFASYRLDSLETQRTCHTSCQFAAQLHTRSEQFTSGAHCPSVNSWPQTCSFSCHVDSDCLSVGLRKCCPSTVCSDELSVKVNRTLSRVCTNHVPSVRDTPLIPDRPVVRQNTDGNTETDVSEPVNHQLELDWLQYYNMTKPFPAGWSSERYPAVFLVQLRQFHDPTASLFMTMNTNPHQAVQSSPMDRYFGEWRSLVWTTKLGAVLSDLKPGTWYQFRLLAISPEGFGGWSEPSKPIRIQNFPIRPSCPRNLSEMRSRILDKHVDVTIHWKPPMTADVPLKKYQITWRRYYNYHGDDRSSFTEYEANVPGDKTIYTIQNLLSSKSYKIQVKAVSMFGQKEIYSHPVSLFVNTLSIPAHSADRVSSNSGSTASAESCDCGNMDQRLYSIEEPFLDNQELTTLIEFNKNDARIRSEQNYSIEWTPQVCIETHELQNQAGVYSENSLILKGNDLTRIRLGQLRYQCHYKITMMEASDEHERLGLSQRWVACFCTPTCHTVRIKSGDHPDNCSNQGRPVQPQQMHLTYELIDPRDYSNFKQKTDLIDSDKIFDVVSIGRETDLHTYGAIIQWSHADSAPTYRVESKRNFRASSSRMARIPSGVKGVRVTWGPRLFEPVKLEAYRQGLEPYLDPYRTQSKVVDQRLSKLVLHGLRPNDVYIVHVQPIGELTDGPISKLFFAIPREIRYDDQPQNSSNLPSTSLPFFVSLLLWINLR